jgi:hypothetical protein
MAIFDLPFSIFGLRELLIDVSRASHLDLFARLDTQRLLDYRPRRLPPPFSQISSQ